MDAESLKQFLSAHGTGAIPSIQELLPAGAGAGGESPDPSALLAKLGGRSPAAAALMQMMMARRPESKTVRECVVIDGTAQELSPELFEELTARLEGDAREIAHLTAQLQTLSAELSVLRERSDLLADALGACSLCWGTDGSCRACRGHGVAGRSIPDADLFEEFVLPAVRLMRASRQPSTVVMPLTPATNRPAA